MQCNRFACKEGIEGDSASGPTLPSAMRGSTLLALSSALRGSVRALATPPLGQDLGELFALYKSPLNKDAPLAKNEEPSALGQLKPRGDVHREPVLEEVVEPLARDPLRLGLPPARHRHAR